MSLFFDTFLLDLCLVPAVLIIVLIFQYFISFSYWKSKNIPFISPKFPFGSVHLLPNEKFKSPEWFAEMYKAARVLKKKYIGLFIFTKPILIVTDPDMIQSILAKDARYFEDRSAKVDRKYFTDVANNFTKQKWKEKRDEIEIMNDMFTMTVKYCENLENLINIYAVQDEPLDIINVFEKLRSMSLSDSRLDIRKCLVYTNSTVSTILNCLYELSKDENEKIQNKIRDEITTILYKYNNQISHNAIIDMTYLDQAIYETLRKYPPVPLLKREFKENYTFSGTNVEIQKGIQLWIPTLGLQNDIWYYPKPDLFNPSRFTKEEQLKRHPFTYLPFGNDPRICLDLQLNILQVKVSLISLLKMYNYSLDPVMKLQFKFVKTGSFPTPDNRIYFRARRI